MNAFVSLLFVQQRQQMNAEARCRSAGDGAPMHQVAAARRLLPACRRLGLVQAFH